MGSLSFAMLPIETIFNIASVVYSVDDPVGIVLHCCGENDNLIILGELAQKFVAVRSHHVEEIIFTSVLRLVSVIFFLGIYEMN